MVSSSFSTVVMLHSCTVVPEFSFTKCDILHAKTENVEVASYNVELLRIEIFICKPHSVTFFCWRFLQPIR